MDSTKASSEGLGLEAELQTITAPKGPSHIWSKVTETAVPLYSY